MRHHIRIISLLAGAAFGAMVPTYAYAAEAEAAASDTDTTGDIVVTAQFRRESAQKTPLSLDVLSAETLQRAGVAQATDIARLSPGVQITQGGSSLQIYIRGAGDFSTTAYSNSAVAQAYDGVFAARTQFVAGSLFDLERVEVLKGPQGTLYGRNSTGGALNIIPAKPKLGAFEGFVTAGVQNYNGFSSEGAVNLPIGESSALRGSYQVVTRDGYISDGTDDDKHHSLRLQFLTEPSENVTLRLGMNYQRLAGKGAGKVVYEPFAPNAPGITSPQPIIPANPWESISTTLNNLIGKTTAPPGIYKLDTSKVYQKVTIWGVNAHLDWNLGPALLTVIPAYQKIKLDQLSMPALYFSTVNYFTGEPSTSDAQTLEVRLGHADSKLKWVLGGYYFNEDQDSYNAVRLGFASDQAFVAKLNTESYAAFGEFTYSLMDSFRFTGGLRYTSESKTVEGHRYNLPGAAGCTVPGAGPQGSCEIFTSAGTFVKGKYSADKLNYKVGIEFDAGPANLIYASVVSGFKSGGQSNADIDPYRSEEVTAYTIGSKNRFFGRMVQLNAELFYMDYRDRQENFSSLDRGGAQVSSLFNAGKAEAKGASVDLTLFPTPHDQLRIAVEYTESEYKEFVYRNYRAANPDARTACAVQSIAGGTAQTGFWTINCTGFQLPRTPNWSGNVSYTHTFELGGGAEIDFTPDMSFASSRWLSAEFVENALADGYALFNASLTYRAPENKYSVQLFMRNIGDKAVYNGTQQYPFINNYNGQDISPPRTYGVRFNVKF